MLQSITMNIYSIIILCTFFIAHSDQERRGNLALSTSQQPGPLFGFGQNIVDQYDLQLFTYGMFNHGNNVNIDDIVPTLLYGIRNDLSLFIYVPWSKNQIDSRSSSGISDLLVQLEYALYEKEKETASDQITLVSNVTFPTGSFQKDPPTGLDKASLFFGYTASSLGVTWYSFQATGIIVPIGNKELCIPPIILYQGGVCRNIGFKPDKWIASFVFEFFGTYQKKQAVPLRIHTIYEVNSFYIGSSLWYSTPHLIIQFGIAFPLKQDLSDITIPRNYLAQFDIGWKF